MDLLSAGYDDILFLKDGASFVGGIIGDVVTVQPIVQVVILGRASLQNTQTFIH